MALTPNPAELLLSMSDDAFGWYFAGLFDGEGCLSVARNRGTGGVSVFAGILMRDDCSPLLDAVCGRLGLGAITHRDGKVRWAVTSRAQVREMLAFMDRYPGLGGKFSVELPLMRQVLNLLDGRGEGRGDRQSLEALIGALSGAKLHPDAVARTETLVCDVGAHEWDRPFVRGRKPKRCPEHSAQLLLR